MGEKIKTLASGKVQGSYLEIELNYPTSKGLDQSVHIQSNKFRLDINRKEYIGYAISILVARRNLKNLKKIK